MYTLTLTLTDKSLAPIIIPHLADRHDVFTALWPMRQLPQRISKITLEYEYEGLTESRPLKLYRSRLWTKRYTMTACHRLEKELETRHQKLS